MNWRHDSTELFKSCLTLKEHPSAFAAELMNEPITLNRKQAFNTWRACAIAINEVIPDMSVSICDVAEGPVFPSWIVDLIGADILLDEDTVEWIKASDNVFYAWHYYPGDQPTVR